MQFDKFRMVYIPFTSIYRQFDGTMMDLMYIYIVVCMCVYHRAMMYASVTDHQTNSVRPLRSHGVGAPLSGFLEIITKQKITENK